MGGVSISIQADSRIPSFAFYVRLGSPVLQVVALSARLDEISLAAPSCPKRTKFWSIWHWALFGQLGPSPAQQLRKIRWDGGAPLPPRPPPAPLRPGWAMPSPKPPPKAPPSAGDRGQTQPKTHRTKNPQKAPCRNSVRLGLGIGLIFRLLVLRGRLRAVYAPPPPHVAPRVPFPRCLSTRSCHPRWWWWWHLGIPPAAAGFWLRAPCSSLHSSIFST
jgi:hypothetical protein